MFCFQIAERAATRISSGRSSPCYEDSFSSPFVSCSPFPWNSPHPHNYRPNTLTSNYRSLPVFQLLELVLNVNIKILDFSKNRKWLESEEMNEISRILWKIVGEICQQLEKFIIPKEITYSSTLNSVICKYSQMSDVRQYVPTYKGGDIFIMLSMNRGHNLYRCNKYNRLVRYIR